SPLTLHDNLVGGGILKSVSCAMNGSLEVRVSLLVESLSGDTIQSIGPPACASKTITQKSAVTVK
ncbi:MAG TPA: hypothetical protein VF335_02170, partial [Chitinivibrionales bacterium]